MTTSRASAGGEAWRISRTALQAIEGHAWAESPRECCGVLIGCEGHVLDARRAPNLSDDPNRYELDPRTHVAALRETRGSGRAVVGFYHSHPHSAPVPSAADLAECTYPDLVHVIVGLAGQTADTRAYRLLGDRYTEVRLCPTGEE